MYILLYPYGDKMNLLKDKRGRIPFAVLGIFLILGSAVTSAILTNLVKENGRSNEKILNGENKKIISKVQTSIIPLIDYVGLRAMQKMAEKPIAEPNISGINPFYRLDLNEDGYPDIYYQHIEKKAWTEKLNYIASREESYKNIKNGFLKWIDNITGKNLKWSDIYRISDKEKKIIEKKLRDRSILEINKNYVRYLIFKNLSNSIKDIYFFDGYKVKIKLPERWEGIGMKNVYMTMKRNGKARTYPVYWSVDIPLNLKIIGNETYNKKIEVSSIITSRIPLIMALIQEFEDDLNGAFSPFWMEATASAFALTWLGGYAQFFVGGPANIISNDFLSLIANGAILFEENSVFGSFDVMAFILLMYNIAKNIIHDVKEIKFNENVESMDEINGHEKNDLLDLFNNPKYSCDFVDENSKKEIDEESKIKFNITDVAERAYIDLLSSSEIEEDIKQAYNATIKIKVHRYDKSPDSYSKVIQKFNDEKEETEENEKNYEEEARNKFMGDKKNIIDVKFDNAWVYGEKHLEDKWNIKNKEKIGEGSFDNTPSCFILHEEKWNVGRYRQHHFSWKTASKWEIDYYYFEKVGNSTIKKYGSKVITINHNHEYDIKEEKNEDVTIDILSDDFSDIRNNGKSIEGRNNIYHPFKQTYFMGYADENMEDALSKYEERIKWGKNVINEILSANSDKYMDGKESNAITIECNHSSWIEMEAINEIKRLIKNELPKLSIEIDRNSYQTPQELSDLATKKLLITLNKNMQILENKSKYYSNGKFYSAGAKAIYDIKERYLLSLLEILKDANGNDGIIGNIKNFFDGVVNKFKKIIGNAEKSIIDHAIDSAFSKREKNLKYGASNLNNDSKAAGGSAIKFLSKKFKLIYDAPLPYNWSEDVEFSIHQNPTFIDPERNKDAIKVRNINIFSPGAGFGDLLDNLIDAGFDALNDQIIGSMDKIFDDAEAYGNETIRNTLNSIVDEIKDEIKEKMANEFYNEADDDLKEILKEKDIDDAIEMVVNCKNNKDFLGAVNNSSISGEIATKIYNSLSKKFDKYYDVIVKEKIKAYVELSLQKLMTQAIKEAKDKIEELYANLSNLLKEKVKNVASEGIEKIVKLNKLIPAGLPILPPFGWWCTLNVWYMEVSGYIPYFKVIDVSSETMPNAIKGGEAIEYVRKFIPDEDERAIKIDGLTIGYHKPISFGFKTGTFIIVPPGKTGVGDRIGGYDEKNYGIK